MLQTVRAALGGAIIGGVVMGSISVASQENKLRRSENARVLALQHDVTVRAEHLEALRTLHGAALESRNECLLSQVYLTGHLLDMLELNRGTLHSLGLQRDGDPEAKDLAINSGSGPATILTKCTRELLVQNILPAGDAMYQALREIRGGLEVSSFSGGGKAVRDAIDALWTRCNEIMTFCQAVS